MKFTAATILAAAAFMAPAVFAQTANTTEYTTGLLAALTAANLTTLATVLQGFPDIATTFASGQNFTVFGPSNEALAPLLANPSALNLTEVMSTLMYHVAPGTVEASSLGNGTNHTIVPSALQAPLLGANRTQPLVLSIGMDGNPRVRTALQNVSVYDTNTYQNLLIHSVDAVIQTPLNLTATVGAANLTQLAGALSLVSPDLPAALSATPRLTIFAPNDAAFANISSILPTLNASQIANVLGNHIINGTVVYSSDISANTTAISSVGETLSFEIANGTVTVVSGNARARVIRTDIPITNGVVHLLDAVLANPESDPAAAASAASSYAEAATAAPSATAGIGGAAAAPTGAASKSTIVGAATAAVALFGSAFALLA